MRKSMVVSIMSKDRPGIISEVSNAIFELGGDIADVNQTVLSGYFTMILATYFDKDVTNEDIFASISHIQSETSLEVSVKEVAGDLVDTKVQLDEAYVITVQGKNKTGIVSHVAALCATHEANILDLDTVLRNGLYSMVIQADMKNSNSTLEALKGDLAAYAKQSELKIMIQHNDIFRATSEVTQH